MKNKVITMFLLASMICTNSAFTAFADEVTDGRADPVTYQTVTNESNDKSPVTEVKASIKSSYEITLPKTMTVNNGDNAYNVNVKGDLAGDEEIAVVPDTTVSLASEGKDAVIGNITQKKQTFTYADASKFSDGINVGTDTTGNININGLTAGHWSGIFNFNVGTNKYVPMSVNLNADKSTAKLEDTVHLTANATDGKAPYQYQFKMREKGTDDWTFLNEYGDSNTYTWTVDKTGTYELAVDIKDANNNVVTKTTDITTVTNIGEDITLTDVSEYNISADGDSFVIPSVVTDKSGMKHTVSGIGGTAFANKTNLTSVTIPNTVTSISDEAFKGCINLKSVVYNDTTYDVKTDLQKALAGADIAAFANTGLYDDNVAINAQNSSSYGITLSGDVIIPEKVTKDGKSYKVTALSSNSTNSDGLLYNNTSVTSLYVPDTVATIYQLALNNSVIEQVHLPSKLTTISSFCFQSCSNLNTINIPDNVSYIGENAFASCKKLTSITLPDNLQSLNGYSFANSGLTSVTYKGVTYTSKSALEQVLTDNGVTLKKVHNNGNFDNTKLTD